MTAFLGRSAWTSSSASGATLSGGELVGVAVHWPGTSQAAIGAASQSAIASRLRSYRSFHVSQRGWRDIGYTFAVDQAGRVWMLRSTQWRGNLVGAHCASASNPRANHKYVGVLLLLGASETPSAAMIEAFQDWYHDRFLPGWPGRTDVRGHGQVAGAQTSCPGSRARAAISEMTKKPGGPTPPPPEDDMTPAQAKQLAEVHKVLTRPVEIRDGIVRPPLTTWMYTYNNARDTRLLLSGLVPLIEAAAAGEGLTAEQVQVVADRVAAVASVELADATVDELAARLDADASA